MFMGKKSKIKVNRRYERKLLIIESMAGRDIS